MDHRIQQLQQQPVPFSPAIRKTTKHTAETGTSFKDVLQSAQELKISKHAKQRMNDRNIAINDQQWQVIAEKMSDAKKKGVTDSLVLTDQAALLVNIKNNTVVTAMHKADAASKIFTNINGTILIDK
ncbi:flagellar protein [Lentibacillus lipolyticus]|nr:flagellar protein [Lentibacillus lipolyticus]